jgi:hypothetical protein
VVPIFVMGGSCASRKARVNMLCVRVRIRLAQ